MRTRHLQLPLLLVASAVPLLLACSVKAPPRASWALSGGAPPSQPALDPQGPALGVTRFTAASDVRTTTLTWRDTDGRQVHETGDTWLDYPDRMLEDLAITRLLRAGHFRSVTSAPPREGLDVVLSCRLVEFGEWSSPTGAETRVTLRWQLVDADGAILRSGEASGRAPVGTRSIAAVVRAHSAAADQAIEALTAEVVR